MGNRSLLQCSCIGCSNYMEYGQISVCLVKIEHPISAVCLDNNDSGSRYICGLYNIVKPSIWVKIFRRQREMFLGET